MTIAFRLFTSVLLVCLVATCTSDTSTSASANDSAVSTSAPAPGTTPAPAITGDLVAGYLTSDPAKAIKGCGCTLRVDDAKEGLFFVFEKDGDTGIINLNGQELTVQRGASLSAGNADYDSYLHQAGDWNIQTSLTDEGPAGDGTVGCSGSVKVKNAKTGQTLQARVTGTCGC